MLVLYICEGRSSAGAMVDKSFTECSFLRPAMKQTLDSQIILPLSRGAYLALYAAIASAFCIHINIGIANPPKSMNITRLHPFTRHTHNNDVHITPRKLDLPASPSPLTSLDLVQRRVVAFASALTDIRCGEKGSAATDYSPEAVAPRLSSPSSRLIRKHPKCS